VKGQKITPSERGENDETQFENQRFQASTNRRYRPMQEHHAAGTYFTFVALRETETNDFNPR